MHFQLKSGYTILGKKTFEEVLEEKYLRVNICNDLNYVTYSCGSESKVPEFITVSVLYKTSDVILIPCNLQVRPHLEYVVEFLSPNYPKNQERLERVQKNATSLILRLRNEQYETILKVLDVLSSQTR